MEKKKVRIYKSSDGSGSYLNKTAKFLKKAQVGMETQQETPVETYINYAYERLVRNTKPEVVYLELINNGLSKETAYAVLTNVIQKMSENGDLDPDYMKKPQEEQQQQQPQAEQQMAETEEEERQASDAEQEEMAMSDEGYYDESEESYAGEEFQEGGYLNTIVSQYDDQSRPAEEVDYLQDIIERTPGVQEGMIFPGIEEYIPDYQPIAWESQEFLPSSSEMKKGGSAKKDFVKRVFDLVKKQKGGDEKTSELGRGKRTDTLNNDVSKRKDGFISTLRETATKAASEKMYDQMMQSGDPELMQIAMSPTSQEEPQQMMQYGGNPFDQFGGSTGGENPLYRFIGGGDNEMMEYEEQDLPFAQSGVAFNADTNGDGIPDYLQRPNPQETFPQNQVKETIETKEEPAKTQEEIIRKATINYIPRRVTTSGGLFRTLAPWNPVMGRNKYVFNITIPGGPVANISNVVQPKTFYKGSDGRLHYIGETTSKSKEAKVQKASKERDNTKLANFLIKSRLAPSLGANMLVGKENLSEPERMTYDPTGLSMRQKRADEKYRKHFGHYPGEGKLPEIGRLPYRPIPTASYSEMSVIPGTMKSKKFDGGATETNAFSPSPNQLPIGYFRDPVTGVIKNLAGDIYKPPTKMTSAQDVTSNPLRYEKNSLTGQAPAITMGTDGKYENKGLLTEKDKQQNQAPQTYTQNINSITLDSESALQQMNAAGNAFAKMLESKDKAAAQRKLYDQLVAENVYGTTNAKDRGTYDINSGLFRQDQMGFNGVIQSGGSIMQTGGYAEGDEIEMTEEELEEFLANGGQVEYL